MFVHELTYVCVCVSHVLCVYEYVFMYKLVHVYVRAGDSHAGDNWKREKLVSEKLAFELKFVSGADVFVKSGWHLRLR